MALLRSSALFALRSRSLATIAPVSRFIRDAPARLPIAVAAPRQAISIRWHSNPVTGAKVYDFAQIQQMSETPSAERTIIGMAFAQNTPYRELMALQMSANLPNTKKASFRLPSISLSSHSPMPCSCPRKNSKTALDLRNQLRTLK
jgi:hypothetical protein